MLLHVRRERFLVITLPAVENKRTGAAEIEEIASTRLAKTPNQGKRCTAPRSQWSRGFLSLGKGTVRFFYILISLSAMSALDRSRELCPWSAAVPTEEASLALPGWVQQQQKQLHHQRFCMFIDGQQQ